MQKIRKLILALLIVAALGSPLLAQSAPPAAGSNLTIGLLLVGPYNDHGWSQATFDGVQYVKAKVPGTDVVYIDSVNSSSRPGTTASQLGESLVAKGAKLVIFNSDDMIDEAVKFAKAHKDIFVVLNSGDQTWKEGKAYQDLPNMVCVMGKMEYMKMIAGVAAAMTTQTGKIGFLGPPHQR